MVDWYEYGGEKSEQEILDLLHQLRRTNWEEYQNVKLIAYLSCRSALRHCGVEVDDPVESDKIIRLSDVRQQKRG